MIMVEWGTDLTATKCFLFLKALSSIRKIFIIDLFQNFIFFTEGSCEYVKNDHVLLNTLAIIGKWTATSEFGTYRLCEQRRFRRACASAPLNGWACAVKICHDAMLEDTNLLDGAQIV